jgi:uncharacterized protein
MTGTLDIRIPIGDGPAPGAAAATGGAAPAHGSVSGLLTRPASARALLVLGHGAGAGMRHPFMERVARELAAREIATLRYQFPYMEAGRKRTDPPATAIAAVRAAIAAADRSAPGLPLFAGGKSFGGRMTSQALAGSAPGRVRGVVFLGFPLHPAGRPSTGRADHLAALPHPMLFVQGTRDPLAHLPLVTRVVAGLGERAALHVLEGGDHSFRVLRRSGRTDDQAMAESGAAVAGWLTGR